MDDKDVGTVLLIFAVIIAIVAILALGFIARGEFIDCIYSNHEITLCEEILGFHWKTGE